MDLWLMFYPFISIMGVWKAHWANWALRPSTVTLSWCHIKSIFQHLSSSTLWWQRWRPWNDAPPASPAGSLHLLVKAEQMFSWCSLSCLSELEPAPDSERLPYGVVTFISTCLVKQMCVCNKPVSCAMMSCTPQRRMDVCRGWGRAAILHHWDKVGQFTAEYHFRFVWQPQCVQWQTGECFLSVMFCWVICCLVVLLQRCCWPWGDGRDTEAGPFIYHPHFMDHEPSVQVWFRVFMVVNILDLWRSQTLWVLLLMLSERFCLINFSFKTLISNPSRLHYFLLQMIAIIIISASKYLLAEQLVLC